MHFREIGRPGSSRPDECKAGRFGWAALGSQARITALLSTPQLLSDSLPCTGSTSRDVSRSRLVSVTNLLFWNCQWLRHSCEDSRSSRLDWNTPPSLPYRPSRPPNTPRSLLYASRVKIYLSLLNLTSILRSASYKLHYWGPADGTSWTAPMTRESLLWNDGSDPSHKSSTLTSIQPTCFRPSRCQSLLNSPRIPRLSMQSTWRMNNKWMSQFFFSLTLTACVFLAKGFFGFTVSGILWFIFNLLLFRIYEEIKPALSQNSPHSSDSPSRLHFH